MNGLTLHKSTLFLFPDPFFDRSPWVHKLLKTKQGGVDRRRSSIDEQVVEDTAKYAACKWRDHRNLSSLSALLENG